MDYILQKAFDDIAESYDKFSFVEREIGLRLFERLDYFKIDPYYILDLGCGTGFFTNLLREKYPKAAIVALDFSWGMLQENCKKDYTKSSFLLQADFSSLPFSDGVFDLIFSNQVLYWDFNLKIFPTLKRILSPKGCLLFSSLGCDSLKPILDSDLIAHAPPFLDMHHLGDALLQAKFNDPVVDQELLNVVCSSPQSLQNSLKSLFPIVNLPLSACEEEIHKSKKYILQYEIIYGHGWGGSHKTSSTKTYVPITQIRRGQV